MSVDLACRDLIELITDYLEGSLSPLERERFEGHLSQCQGCASYLHQMRVTIRAVGRLKAEDIPRPVREPLLQAFRSWRAQLG